MTTDQKLASGPAGVEVSQRIVGGVFQGYNSFLGEAEYTALTGDKKPVSGREKESKLAISASFSEYMQSINIDASVSYGNLGSSASAKLRYAYSLNVTEQAVYVAVYARHALETLQPDTPPSLRKDVPVPGTQEELERFFIQYGDSWVDRATAGAEYIATYTFYCQTVQQSREVQASLAAKNLRLSAGLDAALTEVSTQTKVRVEISQYLVGVNLTMPSDPSKIWSFATTEFMAATPDGLTVIDYSIEGYENVTALTDAFASIVATRDLFSGTTVSPNVSEQLCQLQALSGQVAAIEAVYRRYRYSGDPELAKQGQQVNVDLQAVTQLVNEMGADPTQSYTPLDPVTLTWGTPNLNYRLNYYTPAYGGPGGGPFDDATDYYCPAFVTSGWAITGVTLAGGAWMDWAEITYTALDGSSVTLKHGGGQPTQVTQETRVISQPAGPAPQVAQQRWVINPLGISVSSKLVLRPPGEVITSIWGMWGKFLNQLEISTTNPNNSLKWPPAPDKAPNTATWSAANTGVLAAFRGRAGKYVDQIQMAYLTFTPATWTLPAAQPG